MATSKTSLKKPIAKKSAPKTPPTAKKKEIGKPAKKSVVENNKTERKTKPKPALLTADARRKLLKARDNYDELIERIARTWESNKSLRVPDLSIAKLRKLLRDAERATNRELALREKLERALRPLQDARMVSEDKAWRAVLDVNAAVKLFARSDPALADTFSFLTEALKTNPNGSRNEPNVEAVEAGSS